jgi:hypothetical protein
VILPIQFHFESKSILCRRSVVAYTYLESGLLTFTIHQRWRIFRTALNCSKPFFRCTKDASKKEILNKLLDRHVTVVDCGGLMMKMMRIEFRYHFIKVTNKSIIMLIGLM